MGTPAPVTIWSGGIVGNGQLRRCPDRKSSGNVPANFSGKKIGGERCRYYFYEKECCCLHEKCKKMKWLSYVLLLVVFPVSFSLRAESLPVAGSLTVAPLFATGMVLQCGKPLKIWGTAEPRSRVEVSFGGCRVRTDAGTDGRWRVGLPAMKASAEGRRMEIVSCGEKIVLDDVLVGEVWLAGGQSNMVMSVRSLAPGDREELLSFSDTLIRYYQVMPVVSGRKLRNQPDVVWRRPVPGDTEAWSALSLFFARELRGALGIPVGIVCVAQGSSTAEAWISREYADGHSAVSGAFALGFPGERIEHYYRNPCSLYASMLSRVVGFPLRGFIWYQGESNADRAEHYPVVFEGVIDSWRMGWGDRKLPFLFVQLPAFDKKERREQPSWALIREAQSDVARSIPRTAMAVTVDAGDPGNLHPKDKRTVARRLALVARRTVYGDRYAAVSPVYKSVRFRNGRAFVRFDTGGSPLVARGELREFEICGRDGIWHPATAWLDGNTVTVRSEAVPHPVAVRYAWKNAATVSLYNAAGLPASPFRTDRNY